ncbi:MAG: dTDP-glucose 4,6-dehydratase [Armatimonadota bacterium]|nr:dTDP-glucose 4,6-dehydratase [Armatimonadota bacterium]MCX7776650.1 dTDP-glucose 4,6-dehydratase [Armatimonadota bacterium]MDW8025736.1 dTDP-glucose 4,6-dehydratase [Armatimonadota bacterium]
MPSILIAGGAGFIGSNFARMWMRKHDGFKVIVFDKLTYAGNIDNLHDLLGREGFHFIKGDICDADAVANVFEEFKPDLVVNFAAETHVDRSLLSPGSFIMTDIYGVHTLLEACRKHQVKKFVQVSSDEVYGSLNEGAASETHQLRPRNPYSASKAGGDLMALAYFHTYNLPVVITRGCNTYGPYQHPEKFIPLLITNAIEDMPLPIYGDGMQIRDWLFVEDHCEAIELVIEFGEPGGIYNIAANQEIRNIDVAHLVLEMLGKPKTLIKYVADRPGHDRRYAMDATKLRSLNWTPKYRLEDGLRITVDWYRSNEWWWRKIREHPSFREYYRRMYEQRLWFDTPEEAIKHIHMPTSSV